MISRAPPPIAAWLLERLGPAYRNESLVGDLFEEYQQDRTRAWYWRQVIVAILIGQASGLRRLLFALLALSAGTLTWAGAAPNTPQPCTFQGSSAIYAALDGQAGGH
jgi:hypothetical protein